MNYLGFKITLPISYILCSLFMIQLDEEHPNKKSIAPSHSHLITVYDSIGNQYGYTINHPPTSRDSQIVYKKVLSASLK